MTTKFFFYFHLQSAKLQQIKRTFEYTVIKMKAILPITWHFRASKVKLVFILMPFLSHKHLKRTLKNDFSLISYVSNVSFRRTLLSPLPFTSLGHQFRMLCLWTGSSGHAILNAAANIKGWPKYCLHVSFDKWSKVTALHTLHHTSTNGNYYLMWRTGSMGDFSKFSPKETNGDIIV